MKLEQAEQEPVAIDWEPLQNFWRNNSSIDWEELESAVKCAVAAPVKQAEQKPVAWILTEADGTMDFDCQPTIKPTQNDYDDLREGETFTPLYAAPVRTKDLTDDDIFKTNKTELPDCQDLVDYARAVIAADREKNK